MINWNEKLTELFDGYMSDDYQDKWDQLKSDFHEGDYVSGTVVARAPFGVWVDINLGFPTLLEIIFIEGMNHEIHQKDDYYPVGSHVDATILGFVDSRRQIYIKEKNKDLTAQHYLALYRGRIDAAKQGISSPEEYLVKQMEDLVSSLEKLDENDEVELSTTSGEAKFTYNGSIIGKIKR